VEPLAFLQTLRRLGYLAGDRRFNDLHQYLIGSDLIDHTTGRWSFFGTKKTSVLFDLIEEEIRACGSERQAIADATAAFVLFPEALSFTAAVKHVERLLHAWRKALDKNRSENV
jgi:hypothetical protein